MDTFHFMNDRWVKTNELKISAFDLSVTRGFGVFDFLRTYHNRPFMLEDHIDRFFNSLRILKMESVKTRKEIEEIVKKGIEKNHFSETNIKIIQTGGGSDDGITPNGTYSFIIMFTPATKYPSSYFQKGIKLITFPMGRIFTDAKSLNYMAGVLALQEAKKQKAVEALYIDNEHVYECVTANFYGIKKGVLVTAKKQILIGVTRKIILKLAKKVAIPIEERPIRRQELKTFSEAFISASNKEIMPVVQIDNIGVGVGKPGPVTKKIMKEFKEYTARY